MNSPRNIPMILIKYVNHQWPWKGSFKHKGQHKGQHEGRRFDGTPKRRPVR